MADTQVDSSLRVSQWSDKTHYEYVREDPLRMLQGKSSNNPILVREELSKLPGDRVTFPMVQRLTDAATTDDNLLHGSEEALPAYGKQVTINTYRHAVLVPMHESIKTQIDLVKAARVMLKLWNLEQKRDLLLARMLCPNVDGLSTYAASDATARDAWLAANNPASTNERILVGSAKSFETGDHDVDLAKVDGTNDDLHQDIVRLARRLVQSCTPHITPVQVSSKKGLGVGGERFFMLAGSLPFRDLEANFSSVLQYADVRGEDNQIFAGGQLKIGNVHVFEVPEMDRYNTAGGMTINGVGTGSIDVQACPILGAGALMLAYGQRLTLIPDAWDYKQKKGVASHIVYGCEKHVQNSVDVGMGTVYVSAVGD